MEKEREEEEDQVGEVVKVEIVILQSVRVIVQVR